MHPAHEKILAKIKHPKGKRSRFFESDSYFLSGHTYYGVSAPERRTLAREWMKENEGISNRELFSVLDSLYRGDSHEEKTLASILLGYNTEARKAIAFSRLGAWLEELVGWAEIDTLCSGVFTAEEMLANWDAWASFLRKLARDKNANKRRAALVFLVRPLSGSSDPQPLKLSFEIVDLLKHEKPIIITKAISWVLRAGVKHHKREIASYLKKNAESLPKIAIRETSRKIATGRK